MSQIDRRIQVNTIIENQLPEFVVADFENATELYERLLTDIERHKKDKEKEWDHTQWLWNFIEITCRPDFSSTQIGLHFLLMYALCLIVLSQGFVLILL